MSKYFAIRTIKNGTVKIDGITYAPDTKFMPYDGRLDGMRYVFSRYYDLNTPKPFVSLWGSEEFYRNQDAQWPGPDYIDGRFVWDWWRALPYE